MTTTRSHHHKPERVRVVCYDHPVSRKENPSAHGNVCEIETCECGAERRTNRNGRHSERGNWIGGPR